MILKVFAKSLFLLQGDMDQHARDNALYAFKHGKAKARWLANDVIHRVQKKGTIYRVNLKIPPPRERIKQKACVMNLIFNAVFLIELFQLRWFPGFGCHRCCSTWLGHQKCRELRCLTDSRWVMENHRGHGVTSRQGAVRHQLWCSSQHGGASDVILPDMLQVQIESCPAQEISKTQTSQQEVIRPKDVMVPRSPQDYVHRIGRTGRAGEKGLLDEVSVWFLSWISSWVGKS